MLLLLLENVRVPASADGVGSWLAEGLMPHTTPLMVEHMLGVAAVLLGFTAILVCISVGWYLAWLTSLKDIQFFQELLGRSRQPAGKFTPEQLQAEIARIKAQHRLGSSHSGSTGLYSRAHRVRNSEDRHSLSGASQMHQDYAGRHRHSSSNPTSRRHSANSVSPRSLSDTHGTVL